VDEAVRLALEQNVDIQVIRVNPLIQDEHVASARSAFVPTLSSNVSYNNASRPPDSFLSGSQGGASLKTDFLQSAADVGQFLPWGGTSYSIGLDGLRSTSNNIFTNFDPRLSANLRLSISQPLLRNLSVDANRTQLHITRRNRTISEIDLRSTVVRTVRNVKSAYWDLKYAKANLEVQRQSLDLARQTLKDNRTRVDVGTMAPIDIVEAEAEVARNEEAVIIAEATITQAEDQLRALIFDPSMPDFWAMTLDPIDAPRIDPVAIDIDATIRAALDKRTDLRRAKENLENVGENLRFYRNQTMPQVNLQADYGTTGVGGTQFERSPGFPGPVIGEISRSFRSVLSDVFGNQFPEWTVSLLMSYPIGRSSAEANAARSRLEQTRTQLQIKNIELQIGKEVRDVVRQVNTNVKRIDATRAARVLSDRRLEAEQKKFGVGISTSFLVFQAQRDLATARVNELRAILDYNKSLGDFEATQETALSGSSSIVIEGSSSSGASVGATTLSPTATPR
jgi:outer membrane protein TolC